MRSPPRALLALVALLARSTIAAAGRLRRAGTLPCVNDCSASLANYSVSPAVVPGACVEGRCVCAQGFQGIDCSDFGSDFGGEDAHRSAAVPPPLTDDDVVTCTSDVCTSVCSFGGSCVDDTTCSCYDHWGHGKAPAISSAAAAAAADTAASRSDAGGSDAGGGGGGGGSARVDRRPMTTHDRAVLQRVLHGLGFPEAIPTGGKDPCLTPWHHFSSLNPLPDTTIKDNPNPVLVRCHIDGNVTEIELSRLKLKGRLLPDVGRLRTLRTLSLHNNAITGPLPDALGSLAQLEYLLLYKNQITGVLPSSLTECKSLIALVVYSNRLTGPLPSAIGHLRTQLQVLDVSYNAMSGTIPGSIGHLIALTDMDLSHNEFSGHIPASVQTLPAIKRFRYSDNRFANTVANVGITDVWSDSEHNELAESTYDEWKDGLASEPRERKQAKRNAKEMADLKARVATEAETSASAIDAKVQKLLPPAFRTGSGGGGSGGDLPEQVSGTMTMDGT
jgi:hypothetical protein